MKLKKVRTMALLTVIIAVTAAVNIHAASNVEWNIIKTLQLEATPIDVTITPNGRRTYVLTDQGEILVYSSTQKIEGRIEVGKHVDQLKLGPRGETLILTSGRDKTIQVATIDFIQKINTTGSPFKGAEDAPVVIAVFDDFQWPYCARLVPVLEQVLEKYPNYVKITFKNFPLQNHKFAMPAAIAALAAGEQGKFWEFHDLLFENYNKLNDQKIQEIAQTLGLDQEEYENKKKDPAIKQRIMLDLSDGRQAGVRGTPTIFINGIRLRNRSIQGFQAAINKQLEKIGKTTNKP